jgi:hypothetical protein
MEVTSRTVSFNFRTWIWRAPGILVLAGFLSGCATAALEKTVNRSIAMEERCTIIQKAAPLGPGKAEEALFHALALRLVGTCLEGGQRCLNPAGQAQSGEDVVSAARGVVATIQSASDRRTQFKSRQDWNKESHELIASYFDEVTKVKSRMEQVDIARDNVLKVLIKLRLTVSKAAASLPAGTQAASSAASVVTVVLPSNACAERDTCVAAFAKSLLTIKTELVDNVNALRRAIADVAVSARDLSRLETQVDRLAASVSDQKKIGETEVKLLKAELRRDSEALANSALELDARLQNGAIALGRIFSGDIANAASDLMAAKLYGKVAGRILASIDNMLAQLDQAMAKIDGRVYGGTVLLAQLYSGDMQERFDDIFTQVVAKRFTSQSARLAFADAACQRLGFGAEGVPPPLNNSMFSPFIYAALVNIQAQVQPSGKAEKLTVAAIRQLDNTATATSIATNQKEMRGNVSAVQEREAEDDQVAPTMLQQIAMCASVEQRLRTNTTLRGAELDAQSKTACANAALNSALGQTPILDAVSDASAKNTIEANKLENPPLVSNDVTAAAAWGAALEKIVAALPKTPVSQALLCTKFGPHISGVRCDERSGGAILSFSASFATGKDYDRTLELALATVADLLNSQPSHYQIDVEGYASQARFPCTTSAVDKRCGDTKNLELASRRARWAANVLQRRLTRVGALPIKDSGIVNPLSFDSAADRKIRLLVRPVDNDMSATQVSLNR